MLLSGNIMQKNTNNAIGIVTFDEKGLVCFVSSEFCSFTKYKDSELDNKNVGTFLFPTDAKDKNDLKELLKGFDKGKTFVLLQKNGKTVSVVADCIKISIHHKGTYYICTLYDYGKVGLQYIGSLVMQKTMEFLSSSQEWENNVFKFVCTTLKAEFDLASVSLAIKQIGGEFEVIASSEDESYKPKNTEDKNNDNSFLIPLFSGKIEIGFVRIAAKSELAVTDDLKQTLKIVLEKLSFVLRISGRYQQMTLLARALSSSDSSVFITDLDGNIVWVNKSFTDISKYDYEEILNKNLALLSASEHTDSLFERSIKSVGKTSVVNKDKNGNIYTVQQVVSPMYDNKGQISNFVFVQNSMTSTEDINSVLNQIQMYDSLTNLPNRTLFKEQLSQKIKGCKNGRVAIICIDMAKFHIVNDTLGRLAGDKILKKVSDYISFIASPDDILARLGGDNFGLALSFGDKEELSPILKKISDCVTDNNFPVKDTDVALTVSIGVSVYPDDSKDVGKLLDYADMAVHKALSDGVPYYIFCKEIHDEMKHRMKMERDLRKAVVGGKEFMLYYQPQISIADNKIIGWEALMRWKHPELGMIMPMEFIPIAEETDLILPIGEWALKNALKQWKKWQEAGYPATKMAVNLSAVQFRQRNVADMVSEILREENVPASCLELELTESVVMRDTETASKTLSELSDLGVSLSIDDFGTGYSSFSCLKNFPVNKLKIDRSFISDLEGKSDNIQIVKAIIQLGHILGMEVVVEGVETKGQMQILKNNGCDFVQGFYCAKPMPAEEVPAYLAEKGYIK
jgi:diguanylate cyclase (GGDEF)-like protein/PAS domain S-box-containing protein